MKFFKKIFFGIDEQESYKIKYSKSYNEWYVSFNESIVYNGEKDQCEHYIANVSEL